MIVNGVAYAAWVCKNKRYPRRVKAVLDAAANRYVLRAGPLLALAAQPDDEKEANGPLTREQMEALEEHNEAYQEYLSEAIAALIPDLALADPDAIDVMLEDQAVSLLTSLGYMTEPKREADAAEKTEGEEKRPLAGPRRRRDSAGSTG